MVKQFQWSFSFVERKHASLPQLAARAMTARVYNEQPWKGITLSWKCKLQFPGKFLGDNLSLSSQPNPTQDSKWLMDTSSSQLKKIKVTEGYRSPNRIKNVISSIIELQDL